ncbi:hypothetical protein Hypma_002383 [Hypsizygus marmoreus]|uniref:Uncharacterized protein n=1 Tax=Hypsizygus marmoreus TaxID=39966 RepID=A0A369J3Z2_HYPMA|nr:hypothetical protein Hypma_002383 [Hypsizygus marmoreus]
MLRKPSEVLNSLGSLHDAETFHHILREHVFPFLDKLPTEQTASLVEALEDAEDDLAGASLINFDERSTSISKGIKELKRHVKSDWKEGYEEQAEMMTEIVEEMAGWIPDLWTAGVEQGTEHLLVHKSLKFCKSSLGALANTHSRSNFSDLDSPDIVVEDANGKVVYKNEHGSTEHAVLWVWRDLLLSAIVRVQGTSLAEKLVADLESLDLASEMLDRLEEEITDPPRATKFPKYGSEEYKKVDWAAEEERNLLMNAHLSPEMRAAIPKVKALFVAGGVAKFEIEPTEDVYSSIVYANPNLRDRLLSVAKAHFLTPKDRWTSISSGFGVFQRAGADLELLQLLDLANTPERRFLTDDKTQQAAISYLSGRSPDIRSKTRLHLERGLSQVAALTIQEIKRVFPTLPDAWRYLKDQLDKGKITPAVPDEPSPKRPKPNAPSYGYRSSGILPRDPDPTRDPILKIFISKAGWTPAEERDDSEEEEEEDDYRDFDEQRYNDNTYESPAEKQDIPLAFITVLQEWVGVLNRWPDIPEREAIKESVRATFEDGKYFFDVDGVADKLARRCDYGASEPCRQRLGRAIRELYCAFAKESGEKERMKKDMPSGLSFVVV